MMMAVMVMTISFVRFVLSHHAFRYLLSDYVLFRREFHEIQRCRIGYKT